MKPFIRTYLCNDENQRFFGEGPRQLLHAIEETGSLRSAALSMNMAYTKALRIIRSAEATLGFPLTVRTTGGKGGGGSQMTAEAREFLAKYEAYRDACTESGQQLYEEFFCRRKSVFFSSGTQMSSFTCLQNSNDVRIACIIMASGLGKRFGSNKLMASFHGAPLIHSVLDVTGSVPLFADRLVVTRSREVHDYCQSFGVPVLLHTLPNRNEALRLGLTHLLEKCPDLSGCLFALGDQPLLRPRTLERMCRRYLECKAPIVQLCSVQMAASPEPSVSTTVGSPILFDRAYFDELLHLPEKAGGSHVLRQHPDVVQYVTAEVPEELMDVDTPEELKRLENLVTIE
ncbi:NTP transferase domain-containing protein [Clostridium fessum]|uniref:NTP transferase domain-containing protein n=1 Tax=Clostridium fessum TaxID=2126740 RepID=UPI0022E5CA85|nr:NTP transferase domain-containing protein [Clostridium fessum]